MNHTTITAYSACLILWLTACTQEPVDSAGEIRLNGKLNYILDETGQLDLQTAYKRFQAGDSSLSPTATPDFGVTDATIWLRLDANQLDFGSEDDWVLNIANGRLTQVSVFTLNHLGRVESEFHQQTHTPIQKRTELSRTHSFPIRPDQDLEMILIRVQSQFRAQIPVQLQSRLNHDAHLLRELLIFGLYFGIALIMGSYNLLIFFASQKRVYLLYSHAVFSFALIIFTVRGFGLLVFPDALLPFVGHIGLLGALWPGICLCLFVSHFLQLARKDRPSFLAIQAFLVLMALTAAVYPWLSTIDRSNSIFRLAALIAASLMAITIRRLRDGYRPARFLFWAWLGFLSGILLFVFNKLGILPRNVYTQNGMLFGSAFEMTVLSLGLPVQLRQLRREQETNHQQLERVQNNLDAEIHQRRLLSERVAKLAENVGRAKQELARAHRELDVSEAQLIQAEKMAAVGQLVASVTHDIANPTTHILVSQAALREKLEWLLTEAGKKVPAGKSVTTYQELQKHSALIHTQATHIANIHRAFSNYSRPDTDLRSRVDVGELLEDTMLIITTRVHPHTLETAFEPGCVITCRPSEICQAITNVIANSADALSAVGTEGPSLTDDETGKIRLSLMPSQQDGNDGILIVVEDDGPGLPAVDPTELLKPFFTTKLPSEGTGLGLAITHRIVGRHHGSIHLGHSDSLSGARVQIWLPAPPSTPIKPQP